SGGGGLPTEEDEGCGAQEDAIGAGLVRELPSKGEQRKNSTNQRKGDREGPVEESEETEEHDPDSKRRRQTGTQGGDAKEGMGKTDEDVVPDEVLVGTAGDSLPHGSDCGELRDAPGC